MDEKKKLVQDLPYAFEFLERLLPALDIHAESAVE